MKWCTRNGGDLQGKQFVYIAGGEKAIELYTTGKHEFNVVDRILQKANCAVALGEKLLSEDEIAQFQMMVILVTSELLEDEGVIGIITAAQELSIPILPLMLESGLESSFNMVFESLQCLYPFSCDCTQSPFDEKLQDYLNGTLIGDELEKEVRESFDGYIFLSYRKKDRYYARQLMERIHSFDFCRDIAIWYDEAIIPGEDFNESIYQALMKSDIFMLMVTPNILEDGNYVHEKEYPAAVENGKLIFPVEVAATDRDELKKYDGLTECISFEDTEKLRDVLYGLVSRMPRKQHTDAAYHTYLMGIAYLYGIDVEVNTERGLSLLYEAIEQGCPQAAGKLAEMYREGKVVENNYGKYLYWLGKKLDLLDNDKITLNDFYDKLKTRIRLESDLRKETLYEDAAYHIRNLIFECQLMENILANNGCDKDYLNLVLDIHSRAYRHLNKIATRVGYTYEQARGFMDKARELVSRICLDESSPLELKLIVNSFRVVDILNSVNANPQNRSARLDEAQNIIDSMNDPLDRGKAPDRRLVQWKRNQPLVWYLRSSMGRDMNVRRRYLDMSEKAFEGLIKEFPGDPTIKDDIATVYRDKALFLLHEDIDMAFSYARKAFEKSIEHYSAFRHEESRKNLRQNVNWILRGLFGMYDNNEKVVVGLQNTVDTLLIWAKEAGAEEAIAEAFFDAAGNAYLLNNDHYSLYLYDVAFGLYRGLLDNDISEVRLKRACDILLHRFYLTVITASPDEAYGVLDDHLKFIDTYRRLFGGEDTTNFVYNNCRYAIDETKKVLNILQQMGNIKYMYIYMYKIIELGLIACRTAAVKMDMKPLDYFFNVVIHYFRLLDAEGNRLPALTVAQIEMYHSRFELFSMTAEGFMKAKEYVESAIVLFEDEFINRPTPEGITDYYFCGKYMYNNFMEQSAPVEKLVHCISHVLRPILHLYRMAPEDISCAEAVDAEKQEAAALLERTYRDADALYDSAYRGSRDAGEMLVYIFKILYVNAYRCDIIVEYGQLLEYVKKLLNSFDNVGF